MPERGGELVLKLTPPDAVPSLSPPRRVTALHYELGDVSVEHRVVVVPCGAEREEILARLWDEVAMQLYFDVTEVCLECDAHRRYYCCCLVRGRENIINLLTCENLN